MVENDVVQPQVAESKKVGGKRRKGVEASLRCVASRLWKNSDEMLWLL